MEGYNYNVSNTHTTTVMKPKDKGDATRRDGNAVIILCLQTSRVRAFANWHCRNRFLAVKAAISSIGVRVITSLVAGCMLISASW